MPIDRQLAVKEMKRILKPNGQIYLSLGGTPPFGYVDKTEWENLLKGFTVQRGGSYKEMWAVISPKQGA
jgi:ubiquinone/menaquinone biosynthesis C-methylase UbiE